MHSAAYYLLTGRDGLWLHEGYGSCLVTCLHPHIPERLLVFPEIGDSNGRLAAHVLNTIDSPKNGIQLARHTAQDIQCVNQAMTGLPCARKFKIVVRPEKVLDWLYPVHILDTDVVTAMHGSAFQKIRGKYRQAEAGIRVLSLRDDNTLRMMRACLKYWEGSMIFAAKDEGADDLLSYYDTLFAMVMAWPEMFGGLVFLQGRKPVGFTVWDMPARSKEAAGCGNLLANLSDITVTGLSEFMVVETCRHLRESGIERINFGGSENEGLDTFKRKFQPAESLQLCSADIVYQKAAQTQDVTVTCIPTLKSGSDFAAASRSSTLFQSYRL